MGTRDSLNRWIWTVGTIVWWFCFNQSGSLLDGLVAMIFTVVAAACWMEWADDRENY